MRNAFESSQAKEQSRRPSRQAEGLSAWGALSNQELPTSSRWNLESSPQPNDGLGERSHIELYRRLETDFGNNFYRIIRDLLYKKDKNGFGKNRRDPSSYTPQNDFEFVADKKCQEAMIEEFCETGTVTKKTLNGAHERLAKAICDSGFANEMDHGNYFLRQKHADYLAGRLDFAEGGERDEWILRSVWVLDPSFEESDEAKSLVVDRDYLYKVYGKKIERELLGRNRSKLEILLSQNRPKLENSSQVNDPGQYERAMSKELEEAIKSGILTAGEILKDPFLRKRRIKDLHHWSQKQPPVVEKIWRLDGVDFYNDQGFIDYLNRLQDDNADIFDVSYAEVEQRVTKAIERIPDMTFREILKAYKRNPCQGDQVLIHSLSPILGLSHNPPTILYKESKDGKSSATYYEVAEDGFEENTIVYHENKEQSFFQTIAQTLHLAPINDELFNRIGSIAHEMWHAHQYFGDNVGPELRERYHRNARYYMKPEHVPLVYRTQLLEIEAFAFGEALKARLKEICNKKEPR